MAAGFKYSLNPGANELELARFETAYRISGGFNLEDSDIPDGTIIPQLAPLAVDFSTRKATVVKNVKIVAAITATDTDIKVAKGSLIKANAFIGDGSKGAQISSIDTSHADYDVLTTAVAFGSAKKVGDVLFQATAVGGTTAKTTANALNYASVKKEAGATVTALGSIYEIQESKLYLPISAKDKESLTSRFMFV